MGEEGGEWEANGGAGGKGVDRKGRGGEVEEGEAEEVGLGGGGWCGRE